MRKHYPFALLICSALFSTLHAGAQYCSPTFFSGCFNWRTQALSLGTINWSLDAGDCSVGDYTTLNTVLNAGEPAAMSVTNGNWCGCAVWIDLNDDQAFDAGENLYTTYVGGDPSYTYDFTITIPPGTLPGPHRLRVISPWGSDGVTVGDNGYGPCGSYQYGNFMDLTVTVSGATSVAEAAPEAALALVADPVNEAITLSAAAPLTQVAVMDMQGRVVEQRRATGDRLVLDTHAWPKGVYVVRAETALGTASRRVVVQ